MRAAHAGVSSVGYTGCRVPPRAHPDVKRNKPQKLSTEKAVKPGLPGFPQALGHLNEIA